jgi:hypothetical protein
MEAKKFIMSLIKEGKHFYYDGNVFHAEKAFVVYSVVKWVVERAKEGEFDESQVKNYLNAISSYLRGDISIFWEEGTVYVQKMK